MAKYINIPVDEDTNEMLVELCEAYARGKGAQVRVLVRAEFGKLMDAKLLPSQQKKRNKKVTALGVSEMPINQVTEQGA